MIYILATETHQDIALIDVFRLSIMQSNFWNGENLNNCNSKPLREPRNAKGLH